MVAHSGMEHIWVLWVPRTTRSIVLQSMATSRRFRTPDSGGYDTCIARGQHRACRNNNLPQGPSSEMKLPSRPRWNPLEHGAIPAMRPETWPCRKPGIFSTRKDGPAYVESVASRSAESGRSHGGHVWSLVRRVHRGRPFKRASKLCIYIVVVVIVVGGGLVY